MHVFADLAPYICTFADCPDLLTTYPTRKLWAEHEFANHRSFEQYECHDCSRIFSKEDKFVEHISDEHQYKELNHMQLLATISAAKKSVIQPLSEQQCPLCKKRGWRLQRDFVTHLGRHLEDIALSALPRDVGGDSDSDSSAETEDTNERDFEQRKHPEAMISSAHLQNQQDTQAQADQVAKAGEVDPVDIDWGFSGSEKDQSENKGL
jgi:hypothetical protein